MKVKYSREVDILSIRLSDDPFDCAEEDGGLITHSLRKGNQYCWRFKEPETSSLAP